MNKPTPTHSRTIPWNNGHSGRSVDALLSDFGHQLPRQPEAAAPAHDRTPLFRPANRRGPLRRNHSTTRRAHGRPRTRPAPRTLWEMAQRSPGRASAGEPSAAVQGKIWVK